ncbi:FkbM family methyltransferase [Mesorhizobium sp.]|uniref:FkbM family methyltransferase n=1 Tax=Mesorhizobium sp. TaxID=1871066 RepID=UPI0025D2D448|nr:FkbM family methyltransferase [Mesorhizobium sp.]
MFLSYAQNFEDVILWRALKHVENGFYIDIGAQDPVIDSVSRGFYEKGWRGLHVEPTETYAAKLRDNRPDEEVVQAAIGNGQREISFFEIPETGLSTGELAVAELHRNNGAKIVETTVLLMPLNELFERVGSREIHWLKIDVEGMEQSVLESWPPSSARPWIVVVESTEPNSQIPSHERWEPILLSIGYEFVHFDGLSRYYVSLERQGLKKAFGVGPNIFDNFAISGTAQTTVAAAVNKRAEDLQNDRNNLIGLLDQQAIEISNLNISASKSESRITELENILAAKEVELTKIYMSWSWKMTYPYRRFMRLFRRYK